MSPVAWPTLTLLRRRNAGVAIVVGLAFAASSASAFAVAPGVTIDPGSPAGQQYAFPLSVLRAQGAGDSAPGARSTVPLFGVGVTPATGKTSSAHAGRHSAGAGAGAGAGVGRRARRADAGVTATAGARKRKVIRWSSVGAARLETPHPSRVPVLVALVLVLGVGLGIGLRALRRRS